MIESLREKITIQKNTPSVDKYGNHKLTWEDYYKCSAYVNNLSGKEYWAAAEVNAQDEIVFLIRYCSKASALDTEHYRIVFKGSIYNISFVDHVQYKNRTVKLRAKLEKR